MPKLSVEQGLAFKQKLTERKHEQGSAAARQRRCLEIRADGGRSWGRGRGRGRGCSECGGWGGVVISGAPDGGHGGSAN